jgi:hypothetical protein
MKRRSFSFSARHDKILTRLAAKINVSMVETLQRALESLEEKEVQRDKEFLDLSK